MGDNTESRAHGGTLTIGRMLIMLAILAAIVALVGFAFRDGTGGVATDRRLMDRMHVELALVQEAVEFYNAGDVLQGAPPILETGATPPSGAVRRYLAMSLPPPLAVRIDPVDASIAFAKYLPHITEFHFTWMDGGEGLTVWDGPVTGSPDTLRLSVRPAAQDV